MTTAIFASTIFSGAFLLFLVQPLIGSEVRPPSGQPALFFLSGTDGWVCVLGAITRYFKSLHQITLHVTLLSVSLIFLPVIPDPSLKPSVPRTSEFTSVGDSKARIEIAG